MREVPEGKNSASGRGREKQRVYGEGMVGPRQEAAVVWEKILGFSFESWLRPSQPHGLDKHLSLTFLVCKIKIIIPDSQGDYNEIKHGRPYWKFQRVIQGWGVPSHSLP